MFTFQNEANRDSSDPELEYFGIALNDKRIPIPSQGTSVIYKISSFFFSAAMKNFQF